MRFKRVAENLDRLEPWGTYYARWTVHGQKCRRSLRTTDRRVAEAKLRQQLLRLKALNPARGQLTFAAAAAVWEETVIAARDLKPASKADRAFHLKAIYKAWPGLAETRLDRIAEDDCRAWWSRRAPQISPHRHNNERDSLLQIFQAAVDRHWLLTNPAAGLARRALPEPAIRFPDRRDFQRIIEWLEARPNQEAAWLLELLAYTGLRVNEAARLRWDDVDFERNVFHVRGGMSGTKNRLSRAVPLFPAVRQLFQRIPRVLGDNRLVPIRQCRDALGQACQALQLPHYSHHDLRRFFAVNLIEAGADIPSVATILGHKDGGRTLTTWYLRIRPDHLERVAALNVWTVKGQPRGGSESGAVQQAQ